MKIYGKKHDVMSRDVCLRNQSLKGSWIFCQNLVDIETVDNSQVALAMFFVDEANVGIDYLVVEPPSGSKSLHRSVGKALGETAVLDSQLFGFVLGRLPYFDDF